MAGLVFLNTAVLTAVAVNLDIQGQLAKKVMMMIY